MNRVYLQHSYDRFPFLKNYNIRILLSTYHKINRLVDYFVNSSQQSAYLVLEYLPSDLENQIRVSRLSLTRVKKILKDILEGVNYCHKNNIIHRDIKPSNILIDPKTDQIKLADFGISKQVLSNPRPNTTRIAALHYRSPELILQWTDSTLMPDIWGIGCIFGQCLLGRILFKSQFITEISQLGTIVELLGVDLEPIGGEIGNLKNNMDKVQQKPIENKVNELYQLLPVLGRNLLNKMLIFDPRKRISASQALQHEFLKQQQPFCQLMKAE